MNQNDNTHYRWPIDREKERVRLREFYARNRDKLAAKRKEPTTLARKRAYDKEYRKLRATLERGRIHSKKYNDKPEVKEYRQRYRKVRKSSNMDYQLRRHYGITLEQQMEMLIAQSGRCAICNTILLAIHTDHEEYRGKPRVRGLLCSHCNTGLGIFKEDLGLLESAIGYLRERSVRYNPTTEDLVAKLAQIQIAPMVFGSSNRSEQTRTASAKNTNLAAS